MNRGWLDLRAQHQHIDGLISEVHLHTGHEMHAFAFTPWGRFRRDDKEIDVSTPQGVVR